MAREEGIFAGTSSGLDVIAALQLTRELGPGRTVATVAVDSGLKYLAGDLYATYIGHLARHKLSQFHGGSIADGLQHGISYAQRIC